MRETCHVCPHKCRIEEGGFGRCGSRKNENGKIICANYGLITSLALDPIEKKPLALFYPGSYILSVGSYGCNMSCPFCQNHEIAHPQGSIAVDLRSITCEELCDIAIKKMEHGNIGVAYTYNEALTGYEFVRDTAKLVHEHKLKNVLVTNGMADEEILEELLPYIDAMNIDLKGFTPDIYNRLGGDLETVKKFIVRSAEACHVEITSLIVPGFNDSEDDMRREVQWISSINPDISLHITRYFPRYKMNQPSTDIGLMHRLKKIAEEHLDHVFLGNV